MELKIRAGYSSFLLYFNTSIDLADKQLAIFSLPSLFYACFGNSRSDGSLFLRDGLEFLNKVFIDTLFCKIAKNCLNSKTE